MDLVLIAVIGAPVGLFMTILGLARRDPMPLLFGVALLGIAIAFALFYLLTQIGD